MKVVVKQNGGTIKVIQQGRGTSFAPGRTLFVATSWSAGLDTSTCFTDIPSALAAAAALVPAPDVSHPVVISVYPGLYPDPLTLISNVHFQGVEARGCSITGAVTYNMGTGANASQNGLFERVYFNKIGISGAITIDVTGKTGSALSAVDFRDVDLSGNVTCSGRALSGLADDFHIWNGIHGGSAWNFDGVKPLFYGGCELGAGTLTLTNCTFGAVFSDARCFSALNLVHSSVEGQGSKFNAVNIDGTSVFGPLPGSKVGVVTVAAGGTADVRSAEYFTASNLVGPGAIDRSVWRTTIGPTTAGANIVTLTPSYIDANYNVQVTQADGTPTAITASGKQAGQFTLNDAVGGNTFDVTIIKE